MAKKTGRLRRMAGSGARCYICEQPAEALDHVQPRARGGPDTEDNLRPICTSCNSIKGARWLGAERVEELGQHVLDEVRRARESCLGLLYLFELEGDVLAEKALAHKLRLERMFSPEEREALRKHVQRYVGMRPSSADHSMSGPRIVEMNGSGSFILARDATHLAAIQDYRSRQKEFKQRLRAAGITRPEGCEVCKTVSATRADGGLTPLYPIPRGGDLSSLDVTWMCKRCYDQWLRARRAARNAPRPPPRG